jgi:hypothetical protein
MRFVDARFALFARHLAASSRPILLGPWRAEVGFEVLYWLPFLNWFRHAYHIPDARCISWSRGGAGAWYRTPTNVELYDLISPDEIRVLTLETQVRTGSTKQLRWEGWERTLVDLVGHKLGVKPLVLHPSWMYALLMPFWSDHASPHLLDRYSRINPIPVPALPPNLQLPEKYLAVRFYARPTFTPDEAQTMWMRALVERLARKQPVVLLNAGARLDDHADLLTADPAKHIYSLEPGLTPQTNLAIQSAVLARAQGFVGTYGGLSQLALRLGRPTLACYTAWHSTAAAHLDLTHRLSVLTGVPFHLLRPQDAEHWAGLLG